MIRFEKDHLLIEPLISAMFWKKMKLEYDKIDRIEFPKGDIVYFYLKDMFENLNIEIVGRYQGKLFELMKSGKLEGWCWQTTETAALFMPDDVAIYRGDLYFNKYKTYYKEH